MEMGSSSPVAASVRRPADRKALYRRSNTLSSLPLDALKTAASSSSGEHRRQLEPIMDSPVRVGAGTAAEAAPRSQTTGRAAVARQGRTLDSRRAEFCRKTSCSDLLLSTSGAGGSVRPLYPKTVSSGLADGGGGRLLSKVKERIRDTVLQTTPEWPAVMQERRQRAAIQFEMRAAKMMADEAAAGTATVGESKCAERKSFATTVVDRKETARVAFRQHRSASCEDTVTTMLGGKLHPASAAAAGKTTGRRERRGGSPNSDMTGIICSSKDLESIIELSRQEIASDEKRAPSVSTTSVDDAVFTSSAPCTVISPALLNFQELLEEPSPGTRRCPSGDENRKSLTVEVHAVCSAAAAAAPSVGQSKSVDNDCDVATTSASDDVSVSGRKNATATEVAANVRAASTTKPSDVQYDADGQTWDIYGAALNPEALGDAIQRHLQRIMLTASSIPGMSSQVAAVARAPPPSRDSKEVDLVPAAAAAAAATEKREKTSGGDCPTTERQRNFIQRFLRSVRKRRRSLNVEGSEN